MYRLNLSFSTVNIYLYVCILNQTVIIVQQYKGKQAAIQDQVHHKDKECHYHLIINVINFHPG